MTKNDTPHINLTNSSHLRMDPWKRIFLLQTVNMFWGFVVYVSFGVCASWSLIRKAYIFIDPKEIPLEPDPRLPSPDPRNSQ